MIAALHRINGLLRVLIVALLACLTIGCGITSAQANVITAVHLIEGEQVLPDGGWTSACDARVEICLTPEGADAGELYGPHHHHQFDCQFSALVPASGTSVPKPAAGQMPLPAYAAVMKGADPSAADQPPKI